MYSIGHTSNYYDESLDVCRIMRGLPDNDRDPRPIRTCVILHICTTSDTNNIAVNKYKLNC